MPEPPLLGSYTLPSGVSLNPGVWLVHDPVNALLASAGVFAREADSGGGCYHP